MQEIEALRQEIDKIDSELLELFLKRMELCEKIGDYKKKVGLAIYDPIREEQILNQKPNEAYDFFKSIIEISKKRQKRYFGGR